MFYAMQNKKKTSAGECCLNTTKGLSDRKRKRKGKDEEDSVNRR
jgi:hypothetical protein